MAFEVYLKQGKLCQATAKWRTIGSAFGSRGDYDYLGVLNHRMEHCGGRRMTLSRFELQQDASVEIETTWTRVSGGLVSLKASVSRDTSKMVLTYLLDRQSGCPD